LQAQDFSERTMSLNEKSTTTAAGDSNSQATSVSGLKLCLFFLGFVLHGTHADIFGCCEKWTA